MIVEVDDIQNKATSGSQNVPSLRAWCHWGLSFF